MKNIIVKDGVLTLGTYHSENIKSLVTVCFNEGTIVFNNFNCGNGANWVEKIPIVGRDMSNGKFSNEKWYKDYKRILASGKITKEYCAMIDRMNNT